MRFLFILAFACTSTFISSAQFPTFTLGVLMPDASELTGDLNEAHMQKLESKIIEMVNNSNEVIFGFGNDFVICPKVSVGESGRVEGGMQNIYVTTLELSLSVRQISSNIVYNAFTKKIKGSGNNKETSVSNAISSINPSDNAYTQFIVNSKTKVIAYYKENCNKIMQTAANCEAKKDYEQAISLYQSIPLQAPCYGEASKKAITVYTKYQNVLCGRYITLAKSEIALKNYPEALVALNIVDPTSSCGPEVKKLIAQISGKTDKAEQREYNLEVMRINAVKEIGKAYFAAAASKSRKRR